MLVFRTEQNYVLAHFVGHEYRGDVTLLKWVKESDTRTEWDNDRGICFSERDKIK